MDIKHIEDWLMPVLTSLNVEVYSMLPESIPDSLIYFEVSSVKPLSQISPGAGAEALVVISTIADSNLGARDLADKAVLALDEAFRTDTTAEGITLSHLQITTLPMRIAQVSSVSRRIEFEYRFAARFVFLNS